MRGVTGLSIFNRLDYWDNVECVHPCLMHRNEGLFKRVFDVLRTLIKKKKCSDQMYDLHMYRGVHIPESGQLPWAQSLERLQVRYYRI